MAARAAAAALLENRYFKSANTEVAGGVMRLFGNEIARVMPDGIQCRWWPSRTTADRLSVLGVTVTRRNYQWFLDGKAIYKGDYFFIHKDGRIIIEARNKIPEELS